MARRDELPAPPGGLRALRSPLDLALAHTRGRYRIAAHLRAWNRVALGIHRGDLTRVIISAPPRHGKTWFWLYALAWLTITKAARGHRVIGTAYNATRAAKYGRRVRQIVGELGARGGVQLDSSSKAADRWDILDQETGMLTAGVGGGVTGEGANLLYIDDPVKSAAEAMSEVYRDKVWDWYTYDLLSRLEPSAAIVIVMTRWHEDDLVGRLLAAGPGEDGYANWTVLNFPALCDDPEGDLLGRELGEALWPARWPRAELLKKFVPGSFIGEALYQGKPRALEGNLFKAQNFRRWRWRPDGLIELGDTALDLEGAVIFQTVDLGCTDDEENDPSAVSTWAVWPDEFHLVLLRSDVTHVEAGPDLTGWLVDRYDDAVERFGACDRMLIEKVQMQLALIRYVEAEGVPVGELEADRSKVARALPAVAASERGEFWIPASADDWDADGWIREHLSFPRGKHDDRVDCSSYAVLESGAMTGGGGPPPIEGLGASRQRAVNLRPPARRTG
jgi:phage terminase large subunit-like protein